MKIFISYPPIESIKGTPLLSQNRQFQWFSSFSVIYPVVPASAATLLNKNGYDVVWDDEIAEKKTYNEFLEKLKSEKPDLIAIETKTPVVKKHWQIINQIKEIEPKVITVIYGDHVTALPEESLENSNVDFVLTGGDYDFMLLNLSNHLNKNEKLEPGFYYKENNRIKNTGKFALKHSLDDLPMIDRDLTKWKLYKENGNYSKLPGTYTMFARDCWWGKCTFCSWPALYPVYRTKSVNNAIAEIKNLVNNYKIKEIFDDSGSFPVGKWLKDFCNKMIETGLNKKVVISGNMRFGTLTYDDYSLMKKAGFRMLLFGLESANQNTLNKLEKNITIDDVIIGAKAAKKAKLQPHVTTMIGYPWESIDDAKKTLELTKSLFKNGYIDTLQATIVIPYPSTKLYTYCKDKDLLETIDWNDYDQKKKIMKSPIDEDEMKKLTQGIYSSFINVKFIFRKIISIRSFHDIYFLLRAAKKVFGHLKDFS